MQFIRPSKIEEYQIKNLRFISLNNSAEENFVDIYVESYKCKDECRLLSSIDPYSTTMFNHNQCKLILNEIDFIKKSNNVSDQYGSIIKIIEDVKDGEILVLLGD